MDNLDNSVDAANNLTQSQLVDAAKEAMKLNESIDLTSDENTPLRGMVQLTSSTILMHKFKNDKSQNVHVVNGLDTIHDTEYTEYQNLLKNGKVPFLHEQLGIRPVLYSNCYHGIQVASTGERNSRMGDLGVVRPFVFIVLMLLLWAIVESAMEYRYAVCKNNTLIVINGCEYYTKNGGRTFTHCYDCGNHNN